MIHKKFLSIILVASFTTAVSACAPADFLPLPYISYSGGVPAALHIYNLDKVIITDYEACAFDDKGNLIVFSEPAYAHKDGKSILVGDVQVNVGDKFGGSLYTEIPGGYLCGGRKHPAHHIYGTGITTEKWILRND